MASTLPTRPRWPVALAFLDHRRREDRLSACRRETEINPIRPGRLGVLDVMDEHGEPVDHLVSMRRMPAERRLSALLDAPEAADRVSDAAAGVARFHREAPTSTARPLGATIDEAQRLLGPS